MSGRGGRNGAPPRVERRRRLAERAGLTAPAADEARGAEPEAGAGAAADPAASATDAPAGDAAAREADAGTPDKLYFRIGEVSRIVGVDTHVLRYWESEFRMKPHRSPSGQRLYRKEDLSRFLRIKQLLHDEGYTIAGARRVLAGGSARPSVDPQMVRSALERIVALRGRIARIVEEFEDA